MDLFYVFKFFFNFHKTIKMFCTSIERLELSLKQLYFTEILVLKRDKKLKKKIDCF